MEMNWTRRQFVATSAGSALVSQIKPAPATAAPLDAAVQNHLRAVMDEIIPRQGNMPSASEAGGLEYFSALKQNEPAVAAEVLAAFEKVRNSAPLVEALKQFETEDPKQFAVLRDFVYEAYYTQPQVWKLIGYEFYPTDHKGPHMKPFDEAVIAQVRTKPKYYREA
jgi:hypothetical protein